MKKNKVLFLLHDSEKNNGATHSMMDIIDYLYDKKDIIPILAFPKKNGTAIEYAKEKGYKVYTLRYGRWDFPIKIKSKEKIIYFVKWIIKLMLTFITLNIFSLKIKKENIKVVYTNTYTIFMGCWLKRRCKISHIWHIREFGKEDHNFKIMFGEKILYRYMNFYADKIIFISKSISEKYLPMIEKKNKCVVLYNDINLPNCKIEERWKKVDTINILIAGTIQPGKGQLEVIKAIKILKEKYEFKSFCLYIAGKKGGYYYNTLIEYIKENNLEDYIQFTDFVLEMTNLREKMHIGVVASSNEAFGRVTVEGMLTGMLMIGADAAGTRELIKNNENGYLYPLEDVNRLAEIIYASCKNLENSISIAHKGFEYAKNKFATFKTSEEISKIIKNLSN